MTSACPSRKDLIRNGAPFAFSTDTGLRCSRNGSIMWLIPLRTADSRFMRQPRFSRELFALYEDDAVVALDKPAGLPAVPVKGSDTPSALSLLSANLKMKRQRAFVVHRIDRFTSGILLF